jgi:hypothetical protein
MVLALLKQAVLVTFSYAVSWQRDAVAPWRGESRGDDGSCSWQAALHPGNPEAE